MFADYTWLELVVYGVGCGLAGLLFIQLFGDDAGLGVEETLIGLFVVIPVMGFIGYLTYGLIAGVLLTTTTLTERTADALALGLVEVCIIAFVILEERHVQNQRAQRKQNKPS